MIHIRNLLCYIDTILLHLIIRYAFRLVAPQSTVLSPHGPLVHHRMTLYGIALQESRARAAAHIPCASLSPAAAPSGANKRESSMADELCGHAPQPSCLLLPPVEGTCAAGVGLLGSPRALARPPPRPSFRRSHRLRQGGEAISDLLRPSQRLAWQGRRIWPQGRPWRCAR